MPITVATANEPAAPPQQSSDVLGTMIRIPGGTFMMGSDEFINEQPLHSVTVASFEMDETEVTVAAYSACVKARRCSETELTAYALCNYGKPDRGNHPINCVDWAQAQAFCAWAGKRLPTEEEWEYAARGSDGRKYPWGNSPPSNQLCSSSTTSDGGGTCAVKSFAGGVFELYDMSGNVWEWTASSHSQNNLPIRYSSARVVRGGSWGNLNPDLFLSSFRFRYDPSIRNNCLGFRCAR